MPAKDPLAEILGRSGPDSSTTLAAILLTAVPQGSTELIEPLSTLVRTLTSSQSASVLQTNAVAANTQALFQSTAAQSTGGVGATIGKAASSLLGGFTLSPIMSGLLHLFGGGQPEAPQPLVKFSLPPSLQFDTASTPAGLSGADHGQNGLPRALEGAGMRPSSSMQVNVTVQAMDSRSFMDHSQEIARAVRDAMLNMHSLNDVVTDL